LRQKTPVNAKVCVSCAASLTLPKSNHSEYWLWRMMYFGNELFIRSCYVLNVKDCIIPGFRSAFRHLEQDGRKLYWIAIKL
jgi:hypothetical protein